MRSEWSVWQDVMYGSVSVIDFSLLERDTTQPGHPRYQRALPHAPLLRVGKTGAEPI
jgi:hypothetical protein